MGKFGTAYAKKADEMITAAQTLFEQTNFRTDPAIQLQATVGFITGRMFQLIGEAVDYLEGLEGMSEAEKRLAKFEERNNALRTAAASGNWTEFQRIVSEISGGGGDGGSG